MENTTLSNTFSLQVDNSNIPYLSEAAKWGKFLSILGFIFNFIFLICGLLFIFLVGSFSSDIDTDFQGLNLSPGSGALIIGVYFIVIGLLWFFPCLYLYKFSSKMQAAIRTNDQISLNRAFSNLKSVLKFFGILAIIAICIWFLAITFSVILGTAFSH
jgi:hypothetical protein